MTASGALSRATLGSTYRLQLNGVGFRGAGELVPYFALLGIETLYCSPLTRASPHSTHGYDVVDPGRFDPALGTAQDFAELLHQLHMHGMRLLIDIVPNHMAIDRANTWWWDVLRNGPRSPFADNFDIDWTKHRGRILVPTLDCPLVDAIRDGNAKIHQQHDEPVLVLRGQIFPLAPGTDATEGPLRAEEAVALLARQHYLPASFRMAGDHVNYRRFFDINGLVGIRVEDPSVWQATHAFVLDLVRDDRVAGFRVDHIDGLAAPGRYLEALRTAARRYRTTEPVIVVEKILEEHEDLPDWPVDGTTGYEFADLTGALFVERIAAPTSFAALAELGKRTVLASSFGGMVDRLVDLAAAAAVSHSLDRAALRLAIAELTIHLPVYRTYLDGSNDPGDRDRLETAARAAEPNLNADGRRALDVVVEGLLHGEEQWHEFGVRWQQLTGAVTAKGVEDTATYRVDGPLGLADVGSAADRAPLTPTAFVAAMRRRRSVMPSALNATSTHDSKRSEDLRARLYALTEWWPEWLEQLSRWHIEHADWIASHSGPDTQVMRLMYQTVVAMWPSDAERLDEDTTERLAAYLVKAAREAKLRTSWSDPDEPYETAMVEMVRTLAQSLDSDFGAAAQLWSQRLEAASATTSLALTLLKTVCPGVPDIYQGNELVQYELTDPDNRRRIDFSLRFELLRQQPADSISERQLDGLLRGWSDGRLKLHVLHTALMLRRRLPDLFAFGEVDEPMIDGSAAGHVIAVRRSLRDLVVLAVAPRLTRRLVPEGRFASGSEAWGDTSISMHPNESNCMVDALTGRIFDAGGAVLMADLTEILPVALLVNLS